MGLCCNLCLQSLRIPLQPDKHSEKFEMVEMRILKWLRRMHVLNLGENCKFKTGGNFHLGRQLTCSKTSRSFLFWIRILLILQYTTVVIETQNSAADFVFHFTFLNIFHECMAPFSFPNKGSLRLSILMDSPLSPHPESDTFYSGINLGAKLH